MTIAVRSMCYSTAKSTKQQHALYVTNDRVTGTKDCNLHVHVDTQHAWAARYNTLLLIKLPPKGVVFSFLF